MSKSNLPNEQRCVECDLNLIIGPAIRRGALVYSLPRPYRHNDVIRAMAQAGIPTPIGHGDDEQGFMTVHGFKDRSRAAKLIMREGLLTTEDLW